MDTSKAKELLEAATGCAHGHGPGLGCPHCLPKSILAALVPDILAWAIAATKALDALIVTGSGGPCFRSQNDIPMALRPFQRRAVAAALADWPKLWEEAHD